LDLELIIYSSHPAGDAELDMGLFCWPDPIQSNLDVHNLHPI